MFNFIYNKHLSLLNNKFIFHLVFPFFEFGYNKIVKEITYIKIFIPLYKLSLRRVGGKLVAISRVLIFKIRRNADVTLLAYLCKLLENKNDLERVVFAFNNTGESSFLFGAIKNIKDEKMVLVLTKSYHIDIAKIFCPNIDYEFEPGLNWIHMKIKGYSKIFSVKGTEIILPGLIQYFEEYENEIIRKENPEGFYSRFNRLQLQKTIGTCEKRKPHISRRDRLFANSKMRSNSVGNKFVLLSHQSSSNEQIDFRFWIKLSFEFKKRGYDVVFNSQVNDGANAFGKNFYTTIGEGLEIAKQACAIIGVRSGFLDLAATVNTNIISLYTDFKERPPVFSRIPALKVKKAFSLSELPEMEGCLSYKEFVLIGYDNVRNEYMKNLILQIADFVDNNSEN